MRIPAVEELKKFETGQDSLDGEKKEEIRKRFQEAEKRGDEEGLVVWAGTGVGKVNEVVEAKVSESHSDLLLDFVCADEQCIADAPRISWRSFTGTLWRAFEPAGHPLYLMRDLILLYC